MFSVSELREKQDRKMESLCEPAACLVLYSLSHAGGEALSVSIPTTRHSQEPFVCVYVVVSFKVLLVEKHTNDTPFYKSKTKPPSVAFLDK